MVQLGQLIDLEPAPASAERAYRRNFGVFFVFGPHRLLVYRCFPVFFVLNFKNLKKFINNHKKLGKNMIKI